MPIHGHVPWGHGALPVKALSISFATSVIQPERGPAVRAVLEQLLLVLDATSPDGVIWYPFRGWIWGVRASQTLPVVPVASLRA